MKNASDFPGLYDDIFDFAGAGYVMLDVGNPLKERLPDDILGLAYASPDPSKFWMKGVATQWHVTARGPLDPKVRQVHCDRVLETFNLPTHFELGDVLAFPSPYQNEEYDCLVVEVDDDDLYELNQQLAILPGVQTYVPYKPHVTIGYFLPGYTDELIDALTISKAFYVEQRGIDYGRMKP